MVRQSKPGESLGGLGRVGIGVDADDDLRAPDGGSQGREVVERRASLTRDDRLGICIDVVGVLLRRQSVDPRGYNLSGRPIESLGIGTAGESQPARRKGTQNPLKVGVVSIPLRSAKFALNPLNPGLSGVDAVVTKFTVTSGAAALGGTVDTGKTSRRGKPKTSWTNRSREWEGPWGRLALDG